MQYVLYNPLANNKKGEKLTLEYLEGKLEGGVEFKNLLDLGDGLGEFVEGLSAEDRVILSGGDGTINKFINALSVEVPECAVDFIPVGSGNDFVKDVGMDGDFLDLKKYMVALPRVTVNGNTYKFVNGVGFGIDGYCCETADELKKTSDKPLNYAGIAVKGVLFHFKPRIASVTIDGQELAFKKVWLASSMKGRYYGGGMMVAPEQDRLAGDRKVTLVVWHDVGKILTLLRFSKIFKGEHVKHKKMIYTLQGEEITVKFDRPTALQIDGETVVGVTEYTVSIA